MKGRGNLWYPSADLIKICKIRKSKLQDLKTNNKLYNDQKILHRICVKTSTCMTQHPWILHQADHEALHKFNLIKETCLIYTVLRLIYLAKERKRNEKSARIRKKNCQNLYFSPINNLFSQLYLINYICGIKKQFVEIIDWL